MFGKHLDKDTEIQHIETSPEIDSNAMIDTANSVAATFDEAAEVKLRWKTDLYVIPTVAMLYFLCFIDRVNIGNARLAGLESSLSLSGYDYNMLLSTFYISYILFEIPMNWLCKFMGPGWFLPLMTLIFGILTICFAFVTDKHSAAAVRFLLGVFESGILPGIAYYLSRFYRRSELAFRLALYIVMGPLSGAFSGLLASAILRLDSFGGTHGWQMIFVIEGIITVGFALLAFLTLTDRPETARWLNATEKKLAIARVVSERVAATEVLDNFDKKKIIRGIVNPVVIPTAWVLLFINITVQGISFFTPTVVRSLYPTRSVVTQQLYSVPPFVAGSLFTLVFCYLAWKLDRRNIIMIAGSLVSLLGFAIFLGSSTKQTSLRYAATFIGASGSFAFGALCNAQVSANVVSDTARSSAIGFNVMIGNIGGLISTWSYLPGDGPDYHIGSGLNIAALGMVLLICVGIEVWMNRDNKRRQNEEFKALDKLRGMNLSDIQDLEYKHPAFRWKA
ncbi:major facilitator superfamily domain-containing protein [Phaeosphaeria sp. MPI-PUGE-AT-0046c]|nr:major facilitator superfamily domain-containing protein [Phaeosphaeria sp. MPI-PUGE-AT-0046c]